MTATTDAPGVGVPEVIARFIDGVLAGTPDASAQEALRALAPPASRLAPQLLDLLPHVGEKARYAIATLALDLCALDPGYRPVVETVVRRHPLGPGYQPWLAMRGARLDGEALRWWLDFVADEKLPGPVTHALYQRQDLLLLAQDRDAVAAHLLRTDRGPARHAAELAVEVLVRGGSCPPIEAMIVRWIREGRFDEDVADGTDGSTSAQVLGSCLERGMLEGPFDAGWALVGEAIEHWWAQLSSPEPDRRRRGLWALATLLMFRISLNGALLPALAARGGPRLPEWRSIRRGFSAIDAARRSRRRAARLDATISASAQELTALAEGLRRS